MAEVGGVSQDVKDLPQILLAIMNLEAELQYQSAAYQK